MSIAFDCLNDLRNSVGESPVWSVADQALYWVDIEGRCIHRHDWRTQRVATWAMPERVGCLALHAEGGVLVAMETGIDHVRLDASQDGLGVSSTRLVDAAFAQPGMRYNDGRTDHAGRFWVTSMVRDMGLASPAGELVRVDARGASGPLVAGLVTGNGLAFSPDNHTLYLSDSHPSVQRIWAFDLSDDGLLSHRREFVDMRDRPGRPDGAAVDAEGFYWICGNDAGQVHRFAPNGALDRSLAVPVSKPSMCAFAGPALDHLVVTSIKPAHPVAGFDAALDGSVLVARLSLRGLPETPFAPWLTR